jgi:putative phosphoribosyl transferase
MWPPEHERFADRASAGRALGLEVFDHLQRMLSTTVEAMRPIVLALPRGGVQVGVEVAKAVGGEFDVVISRKIGLPWQPGHGVGAISEYGGALFDRDALACVGLNAGDLSPAVQREREELRRKQQFYRGDRSVADVTGRVVVVVDDGLTGGVTSRAVVRGLRDTGATHIVFAAPVCAGESADCLATEADAVLSLYSPRDFPALGLYYRYFPQLTDADVEHMLAQVWGATPVG